jgi:hypothetical protein
MQIQKLATPWPAFVSVILEPVQFFLENSMASEFFEHVKNMPGARPMDPVKKEKLFRTVTDEVIPKILAAEVRQIQLAHRARNTPLVPHSLR